MFEIKFNRNIFYIGFYENILSESTGVFSVGLSLFSVFSIDFGSSKSVRDLVLLLFSLSLFVFKFIVEFEATFKLSYFLP